MDWTNLFCSGSREVVANNSVIPRTPLMGVRISWLIIAKKSDLTRKADSATSLDFWRLIS